MRLTAPMLLAAAVAVAPCRAAARAPDDGPAPAPAPGGSLPPGDHELALEHGGRPRLALVHVPPRRAGEAAAAPRPVLLAFHGGGGNARQFREQTGLVATSDAHGFLLVHPFGTGPLRRTLLTWNAGTCCGWAVEHGVDDVGFTRALLDELARATPVDAERVYATGFSNGAMLAWRLAAEASDRIAAVAPVAGAMVLPGAAPPRPVPILHIHSMDDPRALYAGGLGPPFPLTRSRQQHEPVAEVLARWVAWNGCPPEALIEESSGAGRDGARVDGHGVTRLLWGPGRDGVEVAHLRLTGAGHVWPGAGRTARERLTGPASDVIDADAEIWAWLSRWTLSRGERDGGDGPGAEDADGGAETGPAGR